MSTTLNRSIQEDFGGVFGIAPKISSGANRRIEIMSRFSSLSNNHDAIQNFDQVNMHLTSTYATRNSKNNSIDGEMLLWSPDDAANQEYSARGAFDRYVWAGAFEERTTGNVFTHTTIDGHPTDGYMMVPSPYLEFFENELRYTGDLDNMDSFRIKIKSNGGIPPNQFIPLFGYTYKSMGQPELFSNSAYDCRRSHHQFQWANNTVYGFQNHTTSEEYKREELGDWDSLITKGCNVPTMIASGSNNLYGYGNDFKDRNNLIRRWWSKESAGTDFNRNALMWFVYAHDGNGNGMLAMHPGEPAETPSGVNSFYKLRPSNAYYGSKNGYFEWVQPYWYTERFFQGANTLSDIWNEVGPNGSWQPLPPIGASFYNPDNNTDVNFSLKYDAMSVNPIINSNATHWNPDHIDIFGADQETPFVHANFRRIWTHAQDGGVPWVVESDFNAYSATLNAEDSADFESNYNWTKYIENQNVHRYWDSNDSRDQRFFNFLGLSFQVYKDYYANNGSRSGNRHTANPQNYAPSQIIAYGPTSNSDLSQETEILINVNSLRGGFRGEENYLPAAGEDYAPKAVGPYSIGYGPTPRYAPSTAGVKFLDHFGINTNTSRTQGFQNGQAVSLHYTGKILDFKFRDIPGQMYYDFVSAYSGYGTPYMDWLGKTQKALVLRASHAAKIEISSFSIANYGKGYSDNDSAWEDHTPIGGLTTWFKDYLRSSSDTEFLFGDSGFSYDPLKDAKNTPSTNIEDPSNSWDNPEYLINNDITLRSALNNTGEANALYIALSGTNALPQGAVDSDYEIKALTINIKAITLSALDYYNLKFAIVSNDKSTTLFQTTDGNDSSPNIGQVPLNNLTQSPPSNGMYSLYFKTSVSEPHYYSDIKDGYLKIWAETQNP